MLDRFPTPHPFLKVDNAVYQTQRERAEAKWFCCTDPADGLPFEKIDQFAKTIIAAYLDAREALFIRRLTAAAIRLDGTQQAVADRIGIDRSCISVAKDHGDLGGRPLAALVADERIVSWLHRNFPFLSREIARAGFIAAARLAYATWHGMPLLDVRLSEEDHEALCQIIHKQSEGHEAETQPDMSPTSAWIEVFTYVFATVEGLGSDELWSDAT